jgi:hypothetical protein
MAQQHYNHQQYPPQNQNGQHQPPPVQTQNLNPYQQHGAYSPPHYQNSPPAMSPNMGSGIPPAKRQRVSPTPPSPAPYHSPFGNSPYGQSHPQSPYATSPHFQQQGGHLSVPGSPATQQPPPFHQPQPYQQQNGMQPQRPPPGSMPPPQAPASKLATDDAELEKPNGRESDINGLSDVLSGSFVDLRAEEEMLLQSSQNRGYGASFNSQGTGSTMTPNTSFNKWSQQGGHGAFQGNGPLSQSLTQTEHEAEFLRKHEQAARILNESAQQPLTDPFLAANVLRHRIAKRAYDTGIQVNVDGLFDKIPDKAPRDSTRTTQAGANGEQIVGLEAASLLNQNASLVEILSLLSLAAEERIRTLVEDAYALSQGRQHTSNGVIPPQLVDIAVVDKDAEAKMVAPVNILKTPWEAPDSAVSPRTTASKRGWDESDRSDETLTAAEPPNATRLPTPPTEVAPTPQRTFQSVNYVAAALKRRVTEDERYEKERLRKRQKREKGATAAVNAEAPTVLLPPPEKMTKKDKDALKKQNQTDDVLHRKANETASMALGGKKKKYSWMNGGGAGAGGAMGTPKPNPVGTVLPGGPAAPATAPNVEKGPVGKKRTFGTDIENTDIGARIQIRDLVHVLENDGREKKTLSLMLARQKNTDRDERRAEFVRSVPAGVGR